MLRVVQSINLNTNALKFGSLPLYYKDCRIGYCLPEVVSLIKQKYLDKFALETDRIYVYSPDTLHQLLLEWRKDGVFPCLNGWRDEKYSIFTKAGLVGTLERSGCGLFGIRTYGVHVNGYTIINNVIHMWVAKRAKTKQTYPGYLDQMVGGGIPSGQSKLDAVIRECEEEASIPQQLARKCKSVGLISYFLENELGYCPETQYCYDLLVDSKFSPKTNDNEVESFQLLELQKVYELILDGKFKPNSAVVAIDFMIRHGFLTPDEEQDYELLVESIRRPLSLELSPPCKQVFK